MVSAAKLKKAQDAVMQIRPYAEKLQHILQTVSATIDDSVESVYTEQRTPDRVLIVLISSNRGLCGAFNSAIAKTAVELAQNKYRVQLQSGKVSFMTVGKQGQKYLKSRQLSVSSDANDIYDSLTFEHTSVIAQDLMDDFESKKFDRIELVYNEFKNAAVQICRSEQFLPVKPSDDEHLTTGNQNFIYEPSIEEIVTELIPKSLRIQLYKALLDSNAAEHGARMTAMHKATDNATDLIKELTLTFNKARQTAITNEILEVTNGAEALNG